MDALREIPNLRHILSFCGKRRHEDGVEVFFEHNQENLERLTTSFGGALKDEPILIDGVAYELQQIPTSKVGREASFILPINAWRAGGIHIYWSVQDFLNYRPNLEAVPESFYIVEDDFKYPEDEPPISIKHYIDTVHFISVLIGLADHKVTLSNSVTSLLVFLHKSRLEMPVVVSNDYATLGLDGVSVVLSLLKDEAHKSQKVSIMKETLHGLLINVEKNDRFNHLLLHFGEFSRRLNENYQLYVSEFSFDDVRREYEESKREYLSKLNDAFSSVQTHMLGIPVSLALAAVKLADVKAANIWTNTFIVLSIGVYCYLMYVLIKNQKHTLNAIKEAYTSQMQRLKHQYSDQYEKIKGIQTELDSRYDYQVGCLDWFHRLVVGLFIIVSALSFAGLISWEQVREQAHIICHNIMFYLNKVRALF